GGRHRTHGSAHGDPSRRTAGARLGQNRLCDPQPSGARKDRRMNLALDDREQSLLAGAEGPAMQLAMRLIAQAAAIMEAETLIPISFAHLDACFYAGQAHV